MAPDVESAGLFTSEHVYLYIPQEAENSMI